MSLTPSKRFVVGVLRVLVFAFLGAFLPLVSGALAAPNWDVAKAALLSAVIAGLAAVVKAATDLLTKGVSPLPQVGILPSQIKP